MKKTKKATTTTTSPLAQLLSGKSPQDFDARALAGKAAWRWDRDQLHEAFLLFEAAAERARDEKDAVHEVTSLNRAAITLFRSGKDPAQARLRLRAVLDHYANHPDDHEDRHFVDWAMTSLLEDEAARSESPAAFTRVYRAAVVEGSKLTDRAWGVFPYIHLERLAEAALKAGAYDVVTELIAARRNKPLPLPRPVKKRLDEMEREIEAATKATKA